MDFPNKDRVKIEADVVRSLRTSNLDYMDAQGPKVKIQVAFNHSSAGTRVAHSYLNYLKAQNYEAYLTHGFEGNKTSFLVVADSLPLRIAEEMRDLLTSPDSPDPYGKGELVSFQVSLNGRPRP